MELTAVRQKGKADRLPAERGNREKCLTFRGSEVVSAPCTAEGPHLYTGHVSSADVNASQLSSLEMSIGDRKVYGNSYRLALKFSKAWPLRGLAVSRNNGD